MQINEYKEKVIKYLKSKEGLTDLAWEELATAILYHSESGLTPNFDKEVFSRKDFEDMYKFKIEVEDESN